MKFCVGHWDKLKESIRVRGLDRFVAKSGAELLDRMKAEVTETEDPKKTFDPLMAAHNMIAMNAMDLVGLELMNLNEDGSERCPLCYINERHKQDCKEENCVFTFDEWTERAADDCFQIAKKIGLVAES